MSRILVPSAGPDSWRQFLAKPELHWAKGFSARTMAYAWEAADGFPPEVHAILSTTLAQLELLLVIPEHKTPLPGGRRESQSDALAIGRHAAGTVVCTIEGKVDEPFGPTVEEWLQTPSPGKTQRLEYLCELLGLADCPGHIRYQLLHRSAAALIESERFDSANAAMIVHSFSPEQKWFAAFEQFVSLFGATILPGQARTLSVSSGRELIVGWACGDVRFRTM